MWVAAAACLMLLAWLGWQIITPGTFHQEYATRIGEIRDIELPEGSRLTLDTDTAVSLDFDGERRLLQLRQGRARFKVEPDVGRPFIVRTLAGDVRVVGTEFEVAVSGAASREAPVAVREGEVRLRPQSGTAATTWEAAPSLRGGEGVRFHADGLAGAIRPIRPIRLETFAPWQKGRLIFDNQALEEVAREVGRYLHEDVRVVSASLRRETVSGIFNHRDLGEFFNALQQMLPVRVRRSSNGTILVEPR